MTTREAALPFVMSYRTLEAAAEARAVELEARLDTTTTELEALRKQNEQLRLANRDLAQRAQNLAAAQLATTATPPRARGKAVLVAVAGALLIALAFGVGQARATQGQTARREVRLPADLEASVLATCSGEPDEPSTTVNGILWWNADETLARVETEAADAPSRCVARSIDGSATHRDDNDLKPRSQHFSLRLPGGLRTGREHR